MSYEITPVWKELKELDAIVRTIEHHKENKRFFVEIDLFISLAEQYEDVLTLEFNTKPYLEEIKEEIRKHLLDTKRDYEQRILTAREEQQLIKLKKLNLVN